MKSGTEKLALAARSLNAMSPLAVLDRGYSITQKRSGQVIRDASAVKPGDELNVRLAKGSLKTEVLSVENE